jgi:dihydroneopterin aldolase / 2-amino-4-hydroxy-6-hydroxymethyldihydropteridine diphosphokinase / dihydropteroate synthase
MLSSNRTFSDTIIIHGLAVQATVGEDRWGKVRAQPIQLSIFLQASLVQAGESDDVSDSIDYGLLCKEILNVVDHQVFKNLYQLTETVANHAMTKDGAETVKVVAEAFNQFLMAESLGVSLSRGRGGIREVTGPDQFFVKDLRVHTIIGVNPRERELKQTVLVNVMFHSPKWDPGRPDWHDLSEKMTKVRAILCILSTSLNGVHGQTIEASSYFTLEALANKVAQVTCCTDGAASVTVRVQKPSALVFAQSSGVEITRTKLFFADGTAAGKRRSGDEDAPDKCSNAEAVQSDSR